MTTITRISKRDENVKKLGTPSQNSLSDDAGPSPPAIPTSQVNDHNGGDLKCSLIAPTPDLEPVIHEFIVDVDSSSEHAQLGGDPSSDHGSKQSFSVPSGDQDPSLLAADSGVAYEPSSANEFSSESPLLSPLFSPIDFPQPDVTAKPQVASSHILLGEAQVAEASVPRPSQSFIHGDTSSTTAVASPTAKLSRPASVQDLLPVCALDIDLFSAKPRAASAPLLSPFDSSSPQTQHALSAHEVERNPTINSSSASSGRQKRELTGSAVDKYRSTSSTPKVALSGNAPNPSSAVPGSSTNRTFHGRSKQTLAEVGIPVMPAPLLEGSPTTISATRYLDEMSEADRREIEQIIKDSIQKTGLLSAPKELIARSRMQKRKRNKNTEATTSAMGPDASQPAIPGHPSTTAALTDSQEAPTPKPKRRRTIKSKKERAIAANPYPRTTTTPPDEVPQQDYAPQVQETHTDIPQAPMPLVGPSSMAPVNIESRSNGGFDPAPSPAVHGNTFSTNMAPTHASAFQHTQSTAPGSTPYSFNTQRNMSINYPQGIIPGAIHPARPPYNPAYVNSQRLLWQRARIAQQIQARRQAGFTDQRYHAPLIPNTMTIPAENEGAWNRQAPSPPSQPLMDPGLPYFFDASQSIQGASGQPGTQSNVYPQYLVPNFDHNIQSGRYHMQHPLFNQAPAGPSHSLQSNGFNPPAFNGQLMPPSTGYESPFHPIHIGGERQREADYVTRPVVPAATAPMQNYPHTLNPSFMNHAVAPINLHDDLTTRGEIPAATSSRLHPGSFISDELTNATQ